MRILLNVQFLEGRDSWTWKPDGCKFTVAAVRDFIQSNSDDIENGWKFWNKWVPPKVNLFTWRADMGRIPVKDQLAKRGVMVDCLNCCRCGEGIESVDHLLCGCWMSKAIWCEVLAWVKLPVNVEFETPINALEFVEGMKGSSLWKQVINLIFQATMWHIWKTRNDKVFSSRQVSDNLVLDEIKSDAFLW
ncbi:uncharacterized protein LOC110931664 [Helianthus annuus]|uniref:uncharacterized protein LOC110931664 n=1 Tax=Helianthus annuus TaxID=4232 RepID=UPI000B8F0446|nr:uncharacterized protein LOC110931664 [Helianthus annuus]